MNFDFILIGVFSLLDISLYVGGRFVERFSEKVIL